MNLKYFFLSILGCFLFSTHLYTQSTCNGCIDNSLINLSTGCPFVYDPVCGCDSVTYPNSCEARYNYGITSYVNGVCGDTSVIPPPPGNCIDTVLINPNAICPQYFDQVCGCDGNTYPNPCYATNVNGVKFYSYGACNDSINLQPLGNCIDSNRINPNSICPFIYDPVCGCDGIIYPNSCYATNIYGVSCFTSGLCSDSVSTPSTGNCVDSNLINPIGICSFVYDPVCGCDSVTYPNSCIATIEYGISYFSNGDCSDSINLPRPFSTPHECLDSNLINLNILCPDYYDPVCGCDGQTYPNSCYARNLIGVVNFIYGSCNNSNNFPSNCIDSTLVDLNSSCEFIYNPVCGCDGVTYPNSCYATNIYGITSFSYGVCSITNISNVFNELNYIIYPNPAKNTLKVIFNNSSETTNKLEVTIYNFTGQKLDSFQTNNLYFDIDLSSFINGIYFLSISNSNQRNIQKFIISK